MRLYGLASVAIASANEQGFSNAEMFEQEIQALTLFQNEHVTCPLSAIFSRSPRLTVKERRFISGVQATK